MTGQQLKRWAAGVHDDAIIEIEQSYVYGSGWKEIPVMKIRAMHITMPETTMDEVCNAEQVSS
jgi:hypothetical protein